jgi:hypothetical protein
VDDDLDISSAYPVNFLSVRKKVANHLPLGLDFLIRRYFMLARFLDIMAWRCKLRFQQQRLG